MNEPRLVARFVADADVVHEVEIRGNRITEWRRERTDTDAAVLTLRVPGPLPPSMRRGLPFLDVPVLHERVRVGSLSGHADRLFPMSAVEAPVAAELLPRFAIAWVLHDGPFGKFAWRSAFVDGRCLLNDAVQVATIEGMPWDAIVEADYVDCMDCFLGELEVRDLIARGNVQGSIAALSTLSWFVERDESVERACEQRVQTNLLRQWVTWARSDEVLTWAARAGIAV